MTVETLSPSGDLLISKIVNNQLYKKRYNGYTKAEAKKLFTTYLKEELAKEFVNEEV